MAAVMKDIANIKKIVLKIIEPESRQYKPKNKNKVAKKNPNLRFEGNSTSEYIISFILLLLSIASFIEGIVTHCLKFAWLNYQQI